MMLGAVVGQSVPPYKNKECSSSSTQDLFPLGLTPDTELGGCKCADEKLLWASGPFTGDYETDGGSKWTKKKFSLTKKNWACYCNDLLMYSSYPIEAETEW